MQISKLIFIIGIIMLTSVPLFCATADDKRDTVEEKIEEFILNPNITIIEPKLTLNYHSLFQNKIDLNYNSFVSVHKINIRTLYDWNFPESATICFDFTPHKPIINWKLKAQCEINKISIMILFRI